MVILIVSYIFKQLKQWKGRFLVTHIIWKLFYETGNIESYLLLKQIENEQQLDEIVHMDIDQKAISTVKTEI